MKILIATPEYNYSGASIAMLELVKYFLKANHKVYVVGRSGDFSNELINAGATILPLEMSIFNENFDLYIANTLYALGFVVEHSNIDKTFLWIHETFHYASQDQYIIKNLGIVKNIICQSKFQIEEYKNTFSSAEYYHLRNHVDGNVSEVLSTSSSFAVTGTWEWRKNQQGLLDTLNCVPQKVSLNFIGSNNPCGIVGHNFWGRVDARTAKNLISNSFGLISASRIETQNISAVEAILSKIPVILSNIPAHQELKSLIPSIVLFDIDNPQSFYDGYQILLKQKHDNDLLENSRKLAIKYFGWDAFTNACDDIFSGFFQ